MEATVQQSPQVLPHRRRCRGVAIHEWPSMKLICNILNLYRVESVLLVEEFFTKSRRCAFRAGKVLPPLAVRVVVNPHRDTKVKCMVYKLRPKLICCAGPR